jgi:ribose-phosphate pyrophosphokinase
MPGIEAAALSAADLLAEMICKDGASSGVLLAAPDEEAQAWTALVAQAVGAPFITLQKTRTGDRDVVISVRDDSSIAGKTVYLVDDIVSTGQTLATAAQLLKSKGAARVEAVIVHALFNEADLKRMKESGVDSVRSTNSITHDSNAISIAPLLAAALNQERR